MSFTCPRCGRTSHNPNDETHRYCGACHVFFEQPLLRPGAARYRPYYSTPVIYRLIAEAVNAETGLPVIIYQSETDGRVLVRSRKSWNGIMRRLESDPSGSVEVPHG